MRKRSIYRGITIAVGLLAACCILLSQPFSTVTTSKKEKAKTESRSEQAKEQSAETFVVAPTDAIPGSAVQMEDSSFIEIESIIGQEEEIQSPVIQTEHAAEFLKVLFRIIISPNAP